MKGFCYHMDFARGDDQFKYALSTLMASALTSIAVFY